MKDKLFLDAADCPLELAHKLGKYFSSGQRKPWIHKSNRQPLITIFSIEPIVLKGQKPTDIELFKI